MSSEIFKCARTAFTTKFKQILSRKTDIQSPMQFHFISYTCNVFSLTASSASEK